MSTSHWYNPFSWRTSKEHQETHNPIIQSPRRPMNRDWTDQYTINSALTKGLYHNSYPGFKLSGAMAFAPIAVPIYLMGLPIPKRPGGDSEDLQKIADNHSGDCGMIHLMSHRDATCWVYPFWSAEERRDVWEFIPDDTICDIVRDIRTNKIKAIITDESISISRGYNDIVTARRRRTFTRESITEEWLEGARNLGDLVSAQYRNVSGQMPIPFSNNKDGDEVRGHSDYERILSDLKNYHDTHLSLSELLTKFAPKMIQYGANLEDWLAANGVIDINDIDISKIDFIFNRYEAEKTEFAFPERAHEAYVEALKLDFRKIVQGSGVPELLWGVKVEGNMASADNQIDSVIQFVEDKQRQKNDAYRELFLATARLRGIATMTQRQQEPIEISWNALDLISEETKSTIFANFSSGLANLINSAGISKEMAYRICKKLYPDITDEDVDTYIQGISEMALHRAFKDAPYENIIGMKE